MDVIRPLGETQKGEKKVTFLSAAHYGRVLLELRQSEAPYPAPKEFVSHNSQGPPIHFEGVTRPAVQEGMENLRS